MISILGRTLVLAALAFAAAGAVTGFAAGASHSPRGYAVTRACAVGFGVSSILANLLMIYALVTHDFSVHYVAEVGSRATPLYYTIISLWASLNGSILFWAGVLGLYVVALAVGYANKHREYMPYTLAVLQSVCVFFALLVASIANPFAPVSPVPLDGPGPNPLLQNHWLMAFHPPTLYIGYVGMVVPFAMGCGALLAGRLEAGWIAPLRRWTLVPWAFLTVAIMLGGWWSYEVLGWGGYWAWDPVENASFMPWLACTAFLHSAMVVERRGTLKTWSLVLLLSTFLLTLVGTFMTRSGVFNSVHSFTQSDIGPVFLGFIAVCLVWSVGLLALREHTLVGAPSRGSVKPVSRETMILAQNVAFTVFTLMVLLGTIYPLMKEAYDGTRLSVGEPFFEKWALPLGTVIVFLMGVGPALPWGGADGAAGTRRLAAPVAGGLLVPAIAYATGLHGPASLLALGVSAFALVSAVRELVEPVLARRAAKGESLGQATVKVITRTHRRVGAHIAHLGVIMTTVALALSAGYQQSVDVTVKKGDTFELAGFVATFTGAVEIQEPHRSAVGAEFTLTRDGASVGTSSPRLNYYPRMREPVGTPAVYSTPSGDLYLSLMQVAPGGASASVRVLWTPAVVWLWVGVVIMSLGGLLSAVPSPRRRAAPVVAPAPGAAT